MAHVSRPPTGNWPPGAATAQPHLLGGQGRRPGCGHAAECPLTPSCGAHLGPGGMAHVPSPLPVTLLPGKTWPVPSLAFLSALWPGAGGARYCAGSRLFWGHGAEASRPGPHWKAARPPHAGPQQSGNGSCTATLARAQDGVAECGNRAQAPSPNVACHPLSLSPGTTSASGRRSSEGRRRPFGSHPSRWTQGPLRSCP